MKFLTSLLLSKWPFTNSAMSYAHMSHTFVDTYIISKRVCFSGRSNHFLTRIVSKHGLTQPATNISVFNISHKTSLFTYFNKHINLLCMYFYQEIFYFREFGLKTGWKISQTIDNTLEVLGIVTKYTSLKIWLNMFYRNELKRHTLLLELIL
jgi:hypothetical protein